MAEQEPVQATPKPKPKRVTKPRAKPTKKTLATAIRNLKPEEIEAVTLYHDECYSCHSKRYQALYSWIIDNRIALRAFEQRRTPLSPDWQREKAAIVAKNPEIRHPFIAIKVKGANAPIVANYKDFEAVI